MSYIQFDRNSAYGPRDGLEGPYQYPNGRILYYDVKEGAYWDPRTDFFLDYDEVSSLQNMIFDTIRVSER